MIDDLTRSILEQRDNIENQRKREIKSNEESYIKQLEQENQQLKLDFDLYKDNHIYKNYEVERKDKQLDLYKEVIEEVRELLKRCIEKYGVHNMNTKDFDELLQILDKAKGSE